eukprot:scaffold301_cov243-Pinguiococcus_pyrenoidosus.AAC.18
MPRHVAEPRRQHGLAAAEDARAPPELGATVLLQHLVHASVGEHVARVDEPVEHLRRVLDELLLLFREHVRRELEVKDEIQSIVVVRHHARQAREIEVVLDVGLVHLHEELVATKIAEPGYPRGLLLTAAEIARLLQVGNASTGGARGACKIETHVSSGQRKRRRRFLNRLPCHADRSNALRPPISRLPPSSLLPSESWPALGRLPRLQIFGCTAVLRMSTAGVSAEWRPFYSVFREFLRGISCAFDRSEIRCAFTTEAVRRSVGRSRVPIPLPSSRWLWCSSSWSQSASPFCVIVLSRLRGHRSRSGALERPVALSGRQIGEAFP